MTLYDRGGHLSDRLLMLEQLGSSRRRALPNRR